MTHDVFSAVQNATTDIDLVDADIELRTDFLGQREAWHLFDRLIDEIPWRQDRISMWGKEYPLPRLHQWFAEPALVYSWSGIKMQPLPWPQSLCALRDKLMRETRASYNTVLANFYRDGNDSVGWHADDEPELGEAPSIASVSLGAARDFQLRHRWLKDLPTTTITLPHGSLLLMRGNTQAMWKHQLPRRKKVSAARVNLTFRCLHAAAAE